MDVGAFGHTYEDQDHVTSLRTVGAFGLRHFVSIARLSSRWGVSSPLSSSKNMSTRQATSAPQLFRRERRPGSKKRSSTLRAFNQLVQNEGWGWG